MSFSVVTNWNNIPNIEFRFKNDSVDTGFLNRTDFLLRDIPAGDNSIIQVKNNNNFWVVFDAELDVLNTSFNKENNYTVWSHDFFSNPVLFPGESGYDGTFYGGRLGSVLCPPNKTFTLLSHTFRSLQNDGGTSCPPFTNLNTNERIYAVGENVGGFQVHSSFPFIQIFSLPLGADPKVEPVLTSFKECNVVDPNGIVPTNKSGYSYVTITDNTGVLQLNNNCAGNIKNTDGNYIPFGNCTVPTTPTPVPTTGTFNVSYSGDCIAPYVISVKAVGDNTERYISGGTNGNGIITFTKSNSSNSYIVTISNGAIIKSHNFNCTTPTPIVSCNNNGTFEILSITNIPNTTTYAVVQNAANHSIGTVKVRNSLGVVVKTFVQTFTVNPQILDLGVLSNGTYTIEYTGISCQGTTNQKSFTVGAIPTPVGCVGITGLTIAGNNTINSNGTGQYTLSYSGSEPLSYSWSIAGQGTSIVSGQNADTVNIQVGSSGNFILTLSVNSCGSTVTTTKNITLNTVPSSCNISFTIDNISCNNSPIPTPVITPVTPTPVVPTPVTSNFTLTEPNKPTYYFSDGHPASYYSNRANLPAIFTNTSTFDAVNDVVYIENQYLKIGLNLKRGGQICYASVAGSTDNKVYNGYDGGFQWVIDATQKLVGGAINGQTSATPWLNTEYNTTMGGDYLNHSQSLIDYHGVPNGYYVKFRPILYPFDSIISEVEIETTYTLVGKSLKIDYTYNSFRTDPTVESNSTSYQGWAVPILFMTNDLTHYSTYAGNQPWTNGALTEGEIPNITGGANLAFGIDAKEYWAVTYNPNNNFAVGAMNISEGGYVRWEQLNKYQGNPPGTVFSGAFTTLSLLASLIIPDGRNYQKSITSYITLGDKTSVIQELRTIAGH